MYAILRTEKMKNAGKIAVSLEHNNRTRNCPNADENLAEKNEYIKTTSFKNLMSETEKYITRKDNVRVVEFVLTASPEFFQNISEEKIQDWKTENILFLEKMFSKDNIKNIVFHRDERTPHMHIHVTPIKDDKLNAKFFIGGKDKLRDLQDNYAKSMSKFGLERGIEGSKAKHDKIKAYYGRVNNQETPIIKLEKPSRIGNLDKYVEENQIKIDEICKIADAKTQELERKSTLLESQKRALENLKEKYKKLEAEEARLKLERENIAIERAKSIKNEVKLAIEDEKKKMAMESIALKKERANLADLALKLAEEEARLKLERENIDIERSKDIKKEVELAIKDEKKKIAEEEKKLNNKKAIFELEKKNFEHEIAEKVEKENASLAFLAEDVAKKYIELEEKTKAFVLKACDDLTKNDHSKYIFYCLNIKNNGNLDGIVSDLEKMKMPVQRMNEVLKHSGTDLKIKSQPGLKR